jgi:uncharacterized protein
MAEHLMAGRWADVRAPNTKELNATTVLVFDIEEASSKQRTAPPQDDVEGCRAGGLGRRPTAGIDPAGTCARSRVGVWSGNPLLRAELRDPITAGKRMLVSV